MHRIYVTIKKRLVHCLINVLCAMVRAHLLFDQLKGYRATDSFT